MSFLAPRPRAPLLALAAPLACALAGPGAALAAVWGLQQCGRSVPVALPAVAGERGGAPRAGAATAGHVVVVLSDGRYLLGGSRLDGAELARRLERLGRLPQAAGERVLVRADAGAPAGRVIALLEMCRRAGLSQVCFEVEGGAER